MKQKNQIISGLLFFSFILNFSLNAQKVTTFKRGSGLIHNNVYSICESVAKDSFLWVGTETGLGRFNGISWEDFTHKINTKVNAILQDCDAHLWIGTDDGLWEFYNETWINLGKPPGSESQYITSLYFDTKKFLWVGTKDGGVCRRSGNGQWDIYDRGTPGLNSNKIKTICEDNQGNIWIGSRDDGVFKFDSNSNWMQIQEITQLIGSNINIIFKDNKDTLWIGSNEGIVKAYNDSIYQKFDDRGIRALVEDGEEKLWLGATNDSLYRYDKISCYRAPVQLNNNPPISCMIRDHAGYLWVGTIGEGISRLHLNWQMFSNDDFGLSDEVIITSIDEDKNANLWIATFTQGIAKFDGHVFTKYNVNDNRIGMNCVNSILVDKDNQIWCATDNGVHCFTNESEWTSYFEDKLANKEVYSILQDNAGIFWFGTKGGVSRFDGTVWQIINNLPNVAISSIWEDHSEHLWFGTFHEGVYEFVDNQIINIYNEQNGLLGNDVKTIIQDKNDAYWFGTNEGISKLESTDWEYFTRYNNTYPHTSVKCLLNDHQDNIWIGSDEGGLSKFDNDFWWDYSDNLVNDEIYTIFQDRENIFWFGTKGGLIKYTPDKMAPQTFIDPLAQDSIISSTSAVFSFNGIDIETPNETLAYSCSLWLTSGTNTQNWSDYSKQTYYEVNLPSNGDYIFFVKAKDADGNEDPSPALYKFKVDITSPTTVINHPKVDDYICGIVEVKGSAFDNSPINDFKNYRLEYAKGDSIALIRDFDWIYIKSDTLPAINNTLAFWNTDTLNGSYFLKLYAEDYLDHSSNFNVHVNVVETMEETYSNLGASIESSQDRISLYIPPGALETNTTIHFSPLNVSGALKIPDSPGSEIIYSSLAYNIGPESLLLYKPAKLTFKYTNSDISNLDENKLSLAYIDTAKNIKLIGGVVNTQFNSIQTTIKKLGIYILVEDNIIKHGQHTISDINCQPRIFSPRGTGFARSTTISFKLNTDSRISIKIYNLTGRLVRNLLKNKPMRVGNNPVDWDGRDYNGQICPSDLYIVTIESPKEVKTKTVMILDKSND